MVRKYKNKNLLPLLAVTAILLSVGLVNISTVADSNVKNTQSVLSKSDENNGNNSEVEVKKVEKKEDIKEVKNEDQKTVEASKEGKKEQEQLRVSSGKIEIESEDEVDTENEDLSDDGNEDDVKTETEFEQESEVATSEGTTNKFKLKIKTRTVNGKTVIETAAGEMTVGEAPEDTINGLVDTNVLDTPTSFEARTNNENQVEYEIKGTESKKFLGIFSVNLPKTVTISANTGEVITLNQNAWTKFLSALSI